jgi:hypothetical protein
MSQTPIANQTFRHVVSRVGTNIPLVWRRPFEAKTSAPTCDYFCPALQALEKVRWNASALGIFFSEKSADFLRAALEACAVNTRIYILAEDKETEAAKKFASGLVPRLRPLLRTISRQGPTAACTATEGFAWTSTIKGKAWRLRLNAEQSATFYERFLYTFWHEAANQHYLAEATWVTQSGPAIEAPFNIPIPNEEHLRLLASDDTGLSNGAASLLISEDLPKQADAKLILTSRSRHSFEQLGTILRPGVTILENELDLPTIFVGASTPATLIMKQAGAAYRLHLSSDQSNDLQTWVKATSSWEFLRDIPRTTQPDYLEASFQLESGPEVIPSKIFPGGSWEKDLGASKANDFTDLKDGRLRKQPTELPEPPVLAVEAVYTWSIKPPEADKAAKRVDAYGEWDKAFSAINGIKKKLILDFDALYKDIDSALAVYPDFKANDLGAAKQRCGEAKDELEMLKPELVGWKHGQAPSGYDPFKKLRDWAKYYEMTVGLPKDSQAHKKWAEDVKTAEADYVLVQDKIAEISQQIKDCQDDLAKPTDTGSSESKPNTNAISGKLQDHLKELGKAQLKLKQKEDEKNRPAPAAIQPGKDRLADRKDLVAPTLPLPTVGELRSIPKIEELILCIQYEEEVSPAQTESARLEKFYGKPIRLVKG